MRYYDVAPLYDTPGADLKYTDDEISSYSDIFDNAETDIDEEDERAVISAIKALSQGDIDHAVDTDEVIRYFAAHNFITCADSYTWKMLHNYGLYEKDGILSMIPWDYNLAFNDPVLSEEGDADQILYNLIHMDMDDPGFLGVTGEDRPMWNWITKDEAYLSSYHKVIKEELLPYFTSGQFQKDMDALSAMIRPYLEQDPTYYYSMEEYDQAYAALIDFCLQRTIYVKNELP